MMKLFLVFWIIGNSAYSSEIDNYTHRYNHQLEDSKDKINGYGDNLIDYALERVNRYESGCNEKNLYISLRKEFNNHYIGRFSKYITFSKDIERIKIKTSDSIYSEFKPKDSIVLGAVARYIKDPLGSIININDHLVGTDKFEHFVGTGFRYFENYYLKNNSIESTLEIGLKDEHGILGAVSTGIISYGDMSAEFNGLRFWNHMLAKNKDILGENLGPYIKCENNKWIKHKKIDFSKYVDNAWDEALNCSKFRTQNMVDKVNKKIKKLEEEIGQKLTCPIFKDLIEQTKIKYGKFSDVIINSDGHKVKKH